nr:insulinase family protein [candidate division Zixibacteria bacterium]
MNMKYFLCCLALMGLVFLSGTISYAERTIDKISIPKLNEIEIPQVDKVVLDNGIIVYLLEDHELPIVRASIMLAAGGYLEPAEKAGLASITGQVMRTGGTARMSGDEIDEALESIGASVEVRIDNTGGSARMNILSDYIDTGLEILADILRTPQFNEDKIDLAKTSERTAISSRNDDALQVGIREFRKVIYGKDSPYTRQTEYATIVAINRDDMVAFHQKYITPENIRLAVWGDFSKDKMLAKIRKYFGDWPTGSGPVPPLPEVKYEYTKAVHYIEKDDVTQSTVLIGHIGGLTGDPDYFAMTVANNVLGGGFGNRMFNEVRSRQGLAYSTGANFTSNIAFPGIYYNFVITKLESTVKASQAVLNEIKRMQTDPPADEELSRAKDSYLNSFVFNFDSKGEIINRMMTYDYFNFPQDFLFTVKDKIEKITANDVIDVAKRKFHPDQMHIVVVGKADQFDSPLSDLGSVDTIDISIPSGEVHEEISVNDETLAQGLDLLRKAVKACGGIENFRKIKSISSKSTLSIHTPQGSMALEASSIQKLPDFDREVINTPMGEIITVNNADGGWMKQGPNVIDLPADQVESNKKEQFRNTILLFQKLDSPDFQAIYMGQEDVGGKMANLVKIMSADGSLSYKLALDPETYLPIGKMYFGETIMGPGNLIQYISDYRDISGVKIPHSVSIESEGSKIADVTINEYIINPEIPAGVFDKP